jgi:Xaa-Pro aminopeptidase
MPVMPNSTPDPIERLTRVMSDEGWDYVLATSPESVYYLSGAFLHTQLLMRRKQCAVLITREGGATLIVAEVEKGLAGRMSRLADLATYKELTESACRVAISLIRKSGRRAVALGIEKMHLPAFDAEDLGKHLPQTRLISADDQLIRLRMCKSAGEVETMGLGARMLDEAILAAVNGATAGAREEAIAAGMEQHIQRSASRKIRSVTGLVASGKNLNVQHHVADATEIRAGDFVRVGCRMVFGGYNAMVVRTAVVGEGSRRSLDHYSRLHDAHLELLDSLRPGITAEQVYERAVVARRVLGASMGLVHVGYAVGLEFQEVPKLAPGSTDILQPGMTFEIVSNSRSDDPADGGIRYIVDMAVIEGQGARLLSNVSDTSAPLRIKLC